MKQKIKSSDIADYFVIHYGTNGNIYKKTKINCLTLNRWKKDFPVFSRQNWKSIYDKLIKHLNKMKLSDEQILNLCKDEATTLVVKGALRNRYKVFKAPDAPKGATHRLMDEYVRYAIHHDKTYGFRFIDGDWVRSECVEKQVREAVKLAVAK